MSFDLSKEIAVFLCLSEQEKLTWLAKLLFFISMFARDTYKPGTDQLDDSVALRKFNELIHRVSSFQLAIALNKLDRIPDDQFFMLLNDSLLEVNISTETFLAKINES